MKLLKYVFLLKHKYVYSPYFVRDFGLFDDDDAFDMNFVISSQIIFVGNTNFSFFAFVTCFSE